MPRSQRRQQLLDAARDAFASSGYHQASMDDIAEHAGVSKPVLYQHFPSKLELYVALLETHIDELVKGIELAVASSTDNRERVRAAVRTYFEFVDSGSGGYRLVFESDLRNDPQVGDRVRKAQDACVAAISKAITCDTSLNEAQAELLGVALVGASVASASGWLDLQDQISRDRAIHLISMLLWRGMSAFPTSSRP